jgi:PPOX class probable FMN-dependent enzyme
MTGDGAQPIPAAGGGDFLVRDLVTLAALYGEPAAPATVKVTDHVTAHYQAFIEASPFAALSTVGEDGADCSPRGDGPGFVRVADPHTLMMPDRRGNNRCDSLRNIVVDGRVGLLFLVPGSGTTLRVNGHAVLSIDPALCRSFAVAGAAPRSVIVITVDAVYFQCARAIIRAELWNPERHVDPHSLPTPGAILAALSSQAVGGAEYDRVWPERARETMW